MQQYRGCFGSCNKPPPLIVAVDEPSKGLRIQGRLVKKPSVSDDFWSTSTCDMDNNSTMQSQRSVSSISFTNNTATSASSSSNPNEFVNTGELIFFPLTLSVNYLLHLSSVLVCFGLFDFQIVFYFIYILVLCYVYSYSCSLLCLFFFYPG